MRLFVKILPHTRDTNDNILSKLHMRPLYYIFVENLDEIYDE